MVLIHGWENYFNVLNYHKFKKYKVIHDLGSFFQFFFNDLGSDYNVQAPTSSLAFISLQ